MGPVSLPALSQGGMGGLGVRSIGARRWAGGEGGPGEAGQGGFDAGQPGVEVAQAGPEVLVGGLQLGLVGVGVLLHEEGGDGGGQAYR